MQLLDEHDPIRKSWRESSAFNVAWLKDGKRLTWIQRIGFAIFSFVVFSSGMVFEVSALNLIWTHEIKLFPVLGALPMVLFGLLFLVPGMLGLRNVLRFPGSRL